MAGSTPSAGPEKNDQKPTTSKEVNTIEEMGAGESFFETYVMEDLDEKKSVPEPKNVKKPQRKDKWRVSDDGQWLERKHHAVRKGIFAPHGVK